MPLSLPLSSRKGFTKQQREALATWSVAFRARQRERDVARHGGREPLRSVEPKDSVLSATSRRFRQSDVRAACPLGHPLTALSKRVEGSQTDEARLNMRVAHLTWVRRLTSSVRAQLIRHGERSHDVRLDSGREETYERKLVHPRELPEPSPRYPGRDEAPLGGHWHTFPTLRFTSTRSTRWPQASERHVPRSRLHDAAALLGERKAPRASSPTSRRSVSTSPRTSAGRTSPDPRSEGRLRPENVRSVTVRILKKRHWPEH